MGESRLSLEGMTQAVRDRPALSLALAAGTGLAIGILAGSYATSKFEEDEPPQTKEGRTGDGSSLAAARNDRDMDGDARAGDNVSESGASTPASTMTVGSSMYSFNKELDEKLDYSLALIYRHDLSLGKGRLVALSTQAALGQFKKLWKGKSEDLKLWEKGSKAKLCLQAEDENELLQVESAAMNEGLPTFKVKDLAGNRRAVAVMAVGPAKSNRVREVTANLKLLL